MSDSTSPTPADIDRLRTAYACTPTDANWQAIAEAFRQPASAPSAQQAAGSIDTPEFWALLNVRDEGAMDDAHAEELEQAIVHYVTEWGNQRYFDGLLIGARCDAAATPAQPIAVSAPTDELPSFVPGSSFMVNMDSLLRWSESMEHGRIATSSVRSLIMAHQTEDAKASAARAAAPVSGPNRAEFIERVLLSVAEIPDRDSPEDQPEMMLVTGEELKGILLSAFEHEDEAAPVSGQGATIGDDTKFMDALERYNIATCKTKDLVACIDRYIDRRPRSEDSRAKAKHVAYFRKASDFGPWIECGTDHEDGVRFTSTALASTTPQKADNA